MYFRKADNVKRTTPNTPTIFVYGSKGGPHCSNWVIHCQNPNLSCELDPSLKRNQLGKHITHTHHGHTMSSASYNTTDFKYDIKQTVFFFKLLALCPHLSIFNILMQEDCFIPKLILLKMFWLCFCDAKKKKSSNKP